MHHDLKNVLSVNCQHIVLKIQTIRVRHQISIFEESIFSFSSFCYYVLRISHVHIHFCVCLFSVALRRKSKYKKNPHSSQHEEGTETDFVRMFIFNVIPIFSTFTSNIIFNLFLYCILEYTTRQTKYWGI